MGRRQTRSAAFSLSETEQDSRFAKAQMGHGNPFSVTKYHHMIRRRTLDPAKKAHDHEKYLTDAQVRGMKLISSGYRTCTLALRSMRKISIKPMDPTITSWLS